MPKLPKKITIIFLIFIFIMFSGFGCKCTPPDVKEGMKPVTLNYWRVWDGPDAFSEIINSYKQIHPFVTINYRKLRYEEFEQELIEAFAEDRGPDIFSIHNTWMNKYENKGFIAPMPEQITMVYPIIQGSIKKEVVAEKRTYNSITVKQLKKDYIDVVPGDVILETKNSKTKKTEERIFGLPLSVDTLVMFYNKDLFNNAGIINPPEFWNKEFQQNIKKLTKQSSKGQIIQSGVGLGGGENITRSTDILSVLMMQNGTDMLSNGRVLFHSTPIGFKDANVVPGLDALRFYTDFANPAKEVYCWNNTLENSLDMFIHEKLAIMFGYAYMLPQIKAENPKLNFAIAKLPQIEYNPTVNFANYWVEVVSNKGKNINEAWDFVQFITKEKQADSYLKNTKKPTALRSLVEKQIEDEEMSVFADQLLTTKSWYKGNNANSAEAIMMEMIDKVNSGEDNIDNIIANGAKKVQQTINE